MTEQETIDKVTAKLTGELYVGARVKHRGAQRFGLVIGTIHSGDGNGIWYVLWPNVNSIYEYYETELELVG